MGDSEELRPGGTPSLLVFSDDWGRHPSSCQHLVRHLLPSYRIYWVNTIGMRPPQLDRATFARGWEKLRHWFEPRLATVDTPDHLEVINPRMWPWFSRSHDRRINRRLLRRQLRPLAQSAGGETIAITTLPIVVDLIEDLPVARWVYYCVDDFSEWPGVDQVAIEEMEALLVRRADILVAASERLQAHLAELGRASNLLTHGVDLDQWTAASKPSALLADLERPLIVFWGLVDRRMDVEFVHRLCGDLDRGTVVLVGPEADPDPRLYENPRVARVPSVPYEDLPSIAAVASVLIMPYADLPVTRAMQPLKLMEYLATDRPVVARELPATRAWADAIDLAATPAEFSQQVRKRLAQGLDASQAHARRRLEQETWAAKAAQFRQIALQ